MSASNVADVASLLDALAVPRGQLLYVQSSADWIQRAGFDASSVLPTLRSWIGEQGTLVLPTYPMSSRHLTYLQSRPVFDVRRTPTATGLIGEIFRRSKDAVRSPDPDFCISAVGREAEAIAGTEPAALDPFGQDSSYQRMIERGATLVGLGVSLNTTSFIHVVDSRCEAGYPSAVYEPEIFSTTVIDAAGRTLDVPRRALRPEFQALTNPSAIGVMMEPGTATFMSIEINGARFFKWDLAAWWGWSIAHAARQAAAGAWPCWLSRLDGKTGAGRIA